MHDEPAFIALQRAFARHLRDPEHVPAPPGLEGRRLELYRDAVYANTARFMADNFPRVRAVMSEARWDAMLRDYLARHVSWTAAFVELPREFLAYLERERDAAADPPFLRELAHFDWLETLVGADLTDPAAAPHEPGGDLLEGRPVVNATLRLVTYAYPVHAITAEFQPAAPPAQATRIAAFRDRAQRYAFLDLNAAAARLLEMLQTGAERSGRTALAALAGELGHADREDFVAAGAAMLERMRRRGAILGSTRPA